MQLAFHNKTELLQEWHANLIEEQKEWLERLNETLSNNEDWDTKTLILKKKISTWVLKNLKADNTMKPNTKRTGNNIRENQLPLKESNSCFAVKIRQKSIHWKLLNCEGTPSSF